MIIRTVLGDERPATRFYEDGSFDCPYCNQPVIAPKMACENPGCDASPFWEPLALKKYRQARDAKAAEDARRRRNHELTMARIHEERVKHQRWVWAQIAEANRRGACIECLFLSGWKRAKFVRHRGPCPKERR